MKEAREGRKDDQKESKKTHPAKKMSEETTCKGLMMEISTEYATLELKCISRIG